MQTGADNSQKPISLRFQGNLPLEQLQRFNGSVPKSDISSQIHTLIKNYSSKQSSEKLLKSQFQQLVRDIMKTRGINLSSKDIETVFNVIDTDKNGYIQFGQIQRIVKETKNNSKKINQKPKK